MIADAGGDEIVSDDDDDIGSSSDSTMEDDSGGGNGEVSLKCAADDEYSYSDSDTLDKSLDLSVNFFLSLRAMHSLGGNPYP